MNDAYNKYEKHGCIHWKYYQQRHPLYYPIVKKVENLIESNSSVLDIGCGDGLTSHVLAQKGCEVTGVDINVKGIEIARDKTSKEKYKVRPQFECKSFEEIPEDKIYDYVITVDVIEHIEDAKGLLRKVKKCGRNFIIGTPEKENDNTKHRFHVKEYSFREMQNMLLKVFNTMQMQRMELSIRGHKRQYLICWGT